MAKLLIEDFNPDDSDEEDRTFLFCGSENPPDRFRAVPWALGFSELELKEILNCSELQDFNLKAKSL